MGESDFFSMSNFEPLKANGETTGGVEQEPGKAVHWTDR